MRKEERQKDKSSDNWKIGLLGLAIGAIGGLIATKIFGEREKEIEKEPTFNTDNYTSLGENENLLCPISQSIMTDPVMIKQCGHTFQRQEIVIWLDKQYFCPLCKIHAGVEDLIQNYTVKNLVEDAIKSGQLKK